MTFLLAFYLVVELHHHEVKKATESKKKGYGVH